MIPLLLSSALSLAVLGTPTSDGGPKHEPTPAPVVQTLAHWSHQMVEQTNQNRLLDVTEGIFGRLEMHDCADCPNLLPVVVTGLLGDQQTTDPDIAVAATSHATCNTSGNCATSNAACSSQELCTSHSSCSSESGCTSGGRCTSGVDCSTGAKCTTGRRCTTGGTCTSEHGGALCSTGAGCPTSGDACPVPPVGTAVATQSSVASVTGLTDSSDSSRTPHLALGLVGLMGLLGLGFDRKRKLAS